MKAAVITTAGMSSRFNEGIPEEKKELKAVYFEDDYTKTLLYHLLQKCEYADSIILVGGYKIDSLKKYLSLLDKSLREKIVLVENDHFEDLGSGYSLYLGLNAAFKDNAKEILFVEGDLDIDDESFKQVVKADRSVLTYTYEPIYANKAVVLYRNGDDKFKYAFNREHGLLLVKEPFSCILNSGQLWKFTDMKVLKEASRLFYEQSRNDTNLGIIQNYLDEHMEVELIPLKRWTNCNTRADYKKIVSYWEVEG